MATFTNQATLAYRGGVVNSNIVAGEIVETLSVTKDALVASYEPNGDIVYVVNFTNSGTTALNNLTFTDDLGSYVFGTGTLTPLSFNNGAIGYYVDGVLQATPTVALVDPLTVTGLSLPAGSVGTLVYRVDVNEFAPLVSGSTIINTATFTGGGLAEPVSDSATVSVGNSPRLDITKAITPTSVGPNGQVTYTLMILNYGNVATVAADDVIVSDTFDPILNPISVTYNGAAWVSGVDYTYNSTTGEFASGAGSVVVPAATYNQDPISGAWTINPGQAVIVVNGTING